MAQVFIIENGTDILICACSHIFHLIESEEGRYEVNQSIDITESAKALPQVKKSADDGANEENVDGIKANNQPEDESVMIVCGRVSSCSTILVVATSVKTCHLLDISTLTVERSFRIPKSPTTIALDEKNKYIVVGDRAGHICRYSYTKPNVSGYKDITGIDCGHEGEPLTGSISMILSVGLSPDYRLLVASDRDEKIRISRYPLSYTVESFCLGHTSYVGTVVVLKDKIFSSGGDSCIREWDLNTGKCISCSESLSQQAIRKIATVEKNNCLHVVACVEDSTELLILSTPLGSNITKIPLSAPAIDIVTCRSNILALTRNDIFAYDICSSSTRRISLPSDVLSAVLSSPDPVPNLFKNVTFNNAEEYLKRKAAKMDEVREKKERKKARETLQTTHI